MKENLLCSKKLISIALAISIFFSFSILAFADDENSAASSDVQSDLQQSDVISSNVVNELLAPDLRDPQLLSIAKDLKATTATTYDLDDIYNIVDECANALVEYDGSEFVSVTEYVHACLTGIASGLFNGSSSNPYLGSINNNIASIKAAVYGPAWDGSGVTNSLWNALQTLYSVNHADQLAQMSKQQGIIDALVGNTQYSLSNKLTNFNNDFNNLNKISVSINSFQGFDLNGNSVNSGTTNLGGFRFQFKTSSFPGNSIYILKLPIRQSNGNNNADFTINFYMNSLRYNTNYTYFSDSSYTYIIFDYIPYYNSNWVYGFEILAQATMYYSTFNPEMSYISSDSSDYYIVSNLLYNRNNNNLINHIDNDLHNFGGDLNKLARMYASDDELQAKEAQQQYESEALSDFTGGGTASASSTDRNGLKSISNTTKSGFDGGGSISNGLSVFNSNNSIWGWFSQDNANYFTPIQDNRSKSTNKGSLIYDIPDYIGQSNDYMYENLGDNYGKSDSK